MLKKICINFLVIVSLSLFVSCKSSKGSSSDDENDDDSNYTETESDTASSSDNFLDVDCETTWSNMVSLLTSGTTFSIDSPRKMNNSALISEEFKVYSSSSSSIMVDKTKRTGLTGNLFYSHWGVQAPQNLAKSSFINQCNEIKNIINNGSYNAKTADTTFSLNGESFSAISLTITPTAAQKGNISRDSVFSKFYTNYIARSTDGNQSYTIVFTKQHMLIYQRTFSYTQMITNETTSITSNMTSFTKK